jgi:hypothetical protein
MKMWREWPVIEWFYRRFVCPKRGHRYMDWYAFGLMQQPYCVHCGAPLPGRKPAEETFTWAVR